ncbi:extracellular solute-binding protein, partial [Pseudomonas sp. BGM005]|nr:extracellular solute-binding protein [Pseudomonas sp. BG5]
MLTTAAVASVSALALAGCASGGGDAEGGDDKITLTVTTFGTFGYEDLYDEYEKANPNVTIEATNIDTGGNARTDAFTKIAAGSGLSDVVAIEEGW